MKTLLYTLLLSISSIVCAQKEATLEETDQTLIWTGKAAIGGYAPEGTLNLGSGSILFTETEINTLTITVNMQSLQQENEQLKGHLRGKDFFDVEKYPTAHFTLTEAARIDDSSNLLLIGKMTIKGKTQIERIPASVVVLDKTIKIFFNHEMDRTKYGVNFNSPSIFKCLKENAIADIFNLKGEVVFIVK